MARQSYQFQAMGKSLELGVRTRLMGIINVTPDSFSDGGCYFEGSAAVERGLQLLEDGADLLDIGGESTHPGSNPIPESVELGRVLPVIEGLRQYSKALISIDTSKSQVAEAALAAGADLVNDISGLRFDPRMVEVVADRAAGVVIMQIRGKPSTMQDLPPSPNLLREVLDDLQVAVNKAYKKGVHHDRILVDPGIGFGKNPGENLVLLNRLSFLRDLDLPLLVGPSRKSFIGKILNKPVQERLLGTAGACAVSVLRGAHVLRVHDVREIREVVDVVDALISERIEI